MNPNKVSMSVASTLPSSLRSPGTTCFAFTLIVKVLATTPSLTAQPESPVNRQRQSLQDQVAVLIGTDVVRRARAHAVRIGEHH